MKFELTPQEHIALADDLAFVQYSTEQGILKCKGLDFKVSDSVGVGCGGHDRYLLVASRPSQPVAIRWWTLQRSKRASGLPIPGCQSETDKPPSTANTWPLT